jgi:hypothetical protein
MIEITTHGGAVVDVWAQTLRRTSCVEIRISGPRRIEDGGVRA